MNAVDSARELAAVGRRLLAVEQGMRLPASLLGAGAPLLDLLVDPLDLLAGLVPAYPAPAAAAALASRSRAPAPVVPHADDPHPALPAWADWPVDASPLAQRGAGARSRAVPQAGPASPAPDAPPDGRVRLAREPEALAALLQANVRSAPHGAGAPVPLPTLPPGAEARAPQAGAAPTDDVYSPALPADGTHGAPHPVHYAQPPSAGAYPDVLHPPILDAAPPEESAPLPLPAAVHNLTYPRRAAGGPTAPEPNRRDTPPAPDPLAAAQGHAPVPEWDAPMLQGAAAPGTHLAAASGAALVAALPPAPAPAPLTPQQIDQVLAELDERIDLMLLRLYGTARG